MERKSFAILYLKSAVHLLITIPDRTASFIIYACLVYSNKLYVSKDDDDEILAVCMRTLKNNWILHLQ